MTNLLSAPSTEARNSMACQSAICKASFLNLCPNEETSTAASGPGAVAADLPAIGACFTHALRGGTRAIVAAAPFSIVAGVFMPVEYLYVALFGWGLWSEVQRSAGVPTLIALGAFGLRIALSGERLPRLLSLALNADTALAVAFTGLSGGAIDVRCRKCAIVERIPTTVASRELVTRKALFTLSILRTLLRKSKRR